MGEPYWTMAATIAYGLWYAAIAAKLAVCVLCVARRIPAPIFALFFAAHSARSLYLLTLQNDPDAYHAIKIATTPVLDVTAGLVAVEAALLLCWRMPRFGWMGAAITGVAGLVAACVSAGSAYAWDWPRASAFAAAAAWDRTTGLMLAPFLVVWIVTMDRFRAADRRAMYHATAVVIMALYAAVSAILSMSREPTMWASYTSSGGALLAYLWWIATVTRIDTTRQEPTGPLDPREVERAWGQSA